MNKYKITLLSKAQDDIAECINFLLKVSIEAAKSLKEDLYDAIESLSKYPEKNPVFEMPSSFRFIVRKQIVNKRYIILYSEVLDGIYVYRVLDGRRNFDGLL